MGGMVLETNMNEIVAQVDLQNRMEKSEVRGASGRGTLGRSLDGWPCPVFQAVSALSNLKY